MRRVLLALTILVLTSTLCPLDIASLAPQGQTIVNSARAIAIPSSYTPHDPILITSDEGFESQGWPGSGTQNDPYVIEELNITTTDDCVVIENTTVHFVIKDCLFKSPGQNDDGSGVRFIHVENGLIESTIAENKKDGFLIEQSGNCRLTDNDALQNSRYGFYLWASNSCVLIDNSAWENGWAGFRVSYSESNTLRNNTATENFGGASIGDGFSLVYSSNCTLTNNTAWDNSAGGFSASVLSNCTLTDNIATDNGASGFYIPASDDCILMGNTASENVGAGFRFGNVIRFTLTNNTAQRNDYIGFLFQSSFDCTLVNNTALENSEFGFELYRSNSFIMLNNTLSPYGIHLASSNSCVVCNNTFGEGGLRVDGDVLSNHLHKVIGNVVDGNPLGYFINITAEVLDACHYGQLFLVNCSDVTAQNGQFHDTYVGVQLFFSNNCTLTNSTTSGNVLAGFRLEYAGNCTLTGNVARQSEQFGFVLWRSNRCTLSDNTASEATVDGFSLWDSDNCTLVNNTAYGCGLHIGCGFGIDKDSTWNILYRNRIGPGNLVNAGDGGLYNTWDDGVNVGNAWSDYYGRGVYSIPKGSIDRYPSHIDFTIDHPLNLSYYFGTTGHAITWTHNTSNPDSFCLFRNGTSVDSRPWDGSPIEVAIDGLDVGIHNFTLCANNTSGYTAIDTVYVQVFEGAPIINHPSDISYEIGTIGNEIVWSPISGSPDSYELYLNESLIDSSLWDGSLVVVNVDGLSEGVYNYTLMVFDSNANSVHDTVFVTVLAAEAPTIDQPQDLQYMIGTTGHSITWSPSDYSPNSYEVYRNGTLIESDSWDGSQIIVNVDGLDVGTHNFTLRVLDAGGRHTCDTVFVSVSINAEHMPKWLDIPGLQFAEQGSFYRYDANATCPLGLDRWWLKQTSDFAIDQEGVVTNSTTLSPGEYVFAVYVNDTAGNEISLGMFVIVYKGIGFSMTEDAYQFDNWNFTWEEYDNFIRDLWENPETRIWYRALRQLYPQMAEYGHCFGMAYTASGYFTGLLDSSEGTPTRELDKNDALFNIQLYHALQREITRAVGEELTPLEAFQEIKALIDSGIPPILGFDEHAVTVVGYCEGIANRLIVYDNNHNATFERYSIGSDYLSGYFGVETGNLWVIEPAATFDVNDLITIIPSYFEGYVGLSFWSPVDIEVTSNEGHVIRTSGATVVENSIPGAYASIAGEGKVFLLPSDYTYTVHAEGTGSGTVDIGLICEEDGQLLLYTFTDIGVNDGTILELDVEGLEPSALRVDDDGDGVVDWTIEADTTAETTTTTTTTGPTGPTDGELAELPDMILLVSVVGLAVVVIIVVAAKRR